MTTITFPSNTSEIISEIRKAVGRDVTFVTVPSSSPCPICSLDPITNTSTDSFCYYCSGDFWVPIYSSYVTIAHILWRPFDFVSWQRAGQLFDGDCRLQLEYTPENITVLDITSYVVVDDKRLEIKRKEFRGVPEINRVILDLIESEKED